MSKFVNDLHYTYTRDMTFGSVRISGHLNSLDNDDGPFIGKYMDGSFRILMCDKRIKYCNSC